MTKCFVYLQTKNVKKKNKMQKIYLHQFVQIMCRQRFGFSQLTTGARGFGITIDPPT